MLELDGREQNGVDSRLQHKEKEHRNVTPHPPELQIPKNRSTGNLLANASRSPEKGRIRFSFDAGLAPADFDALARSPVMTEHEHGLGTCGLRRIRQHPPPRAPTLPPSESSSRNASIVRSSSMTLMLPSGPYNGSSGALTSGQSSPTLHFTEDLTRFPSESLHSFSFAQQSEEFIHSRQNMLKRSIEFMKDKFGWSTASASMASAQARATGDHEMQSMLELMARARRMESDATGGLMIDLNTGPLTGPPTMENENLFDRSFLPYSSSPENYGSTTTSPLMIKKPMDNQRARNESLVDRKPMTSTREASSSGEVSSEPSSRTPTNESGTTQKTSPPSTRRQSLKRTYTDTSPLALQIKLMDVMAQPYIAGESFNDHLSPIIPNFSASSSFGVSGPHPVVPAVHGHASRWAPAAQAIFTTESKAPWTILAANDLACLVFGVTKAEVRKMGILEVVREERRAWLEEKLGQPGSEADHKARTSSQSRSIQGSPTSAPQFLLAKGGLTASLLSKPPSRSATPNRRSQTVDSGSSTKRRAGKVGLHHNTNKSRGVLLCGDVVPIQKRNGHTGSASLWVKEKRGGLIWVLEEIHEDVAIVSVDDDGRITKITGSIEPIWGESFTQIGMDLGSLLPRIPRQGIDPRTGELDYAEIVKWKYFTARNSCHTNIPVTVEKVPDSTELRVSSFPHIAGIMVLNSNTLEITSSNSVFSAALFGQDHPDGLLITDLIPDFDRLLRILIDEDDVQLVDGIVIPEHSFRRARAFLALREGKADAASYFLRPDGLPARHRDGSLIKIDVQMRVIKSDKQTPVYDEHVITEDPNGCNTAQSEVVYALWVTHSRHLHSSRHNLATSPMFSRTGTPLRQPSPGQNEVVSPAPVDTDSDSPKKELFHSSLLTKQLQEAASKPAAESARDNFSVLKGPEKEKSALEVADTAKSIEDFVILEEMGQGAYGQVKLARYKKTGAKVVLKYVTKRRILVDTWTRDRRLGTVPLEIHVLDYLRRDGLSHPNIVEMADFFEDSVNYYIEMVPHGLPGMDLFDYIELRVNMQAAECRSIFVQVAKAIHHLHTKALVVHRDIKDENVVLDGDGNIKLIDFGSAAYIKNGPFDVFVGTIDYAAPEVLAGRPYLGKEQDVWALGILLYTIIYKENPFYSIDEIMDRDLRIPYVLSEDSIDLIRQMLNRDVDSRITIEAVLEHPWCNKDLDRDD